MKHYFRLEMSNYLAYGMMVAEVTEHSGQPVVVTMGCAARDVAF